MADTLILNVTDGFDLNTLAEKLRDSFQGQGFNATLAVLSEKSARLILDKKCGGINMLLGLGLGITVNLSLNGDMLYVNYTDGDWMGKIIGVAVGWILCWIPFITAIIGGIRQLGFSKSISTEITMILAGMNNN